MDPLAVVEEKLDTVDRLPSSVLIDLFFEDSLVGGVSRWVAAFLMVMVFV